MRGMRFPGPFPRLSSPPLSLPLPFASLPFSLSLCVYMRSGVFNHCSSPAFPQCLGFFCV